MSILTPAEAAAVLAKLLKLQGQAHPCYEFEVLQVIGLRNKAVMLGVLNHVEPTLATLRDRLREVRARLAVQLERRRQWSLRFLSPHTISNPNDNVLVLMSFQQELAKGVILADDPLMPRLWAWPPDAKLTDYITRQGVVGSEMREQVGQFLKAIELGATPPAAATPSTSVTASPAVTAASGGAPGGNGSGTSNATPAGNGTAIIVGGGLALVALLTLLA